ncbi:nucleotide-binding alpha-beta plait domain-containing protein [Tanacetum coccineum]
MGMYRSKEDELAKLSSSIFVTNFPDKFSAKELWTVCKQYGTVVDAFIPDRRSKAGKRGVILKRWPKTNLEKEKASVEVKEGCNSVHKETRSEDPFNIYDLLDKKKSAYCDIPNSDDTLKYPLGFTPENCMGCSKKCFKVLGYGGVITCHKVHDVGAEISNED